MNPWTEGKDNGGETAPGVTATEVKVVVYQPNDSMLSQQQASGGQVPTNQATKERATVEAAFTDFAQAYEHAIEHLRHVSDVGPQAGASSSSPRAGATRPRSAPTRSR